jgi:hypothetical protein
MILNNNVNIRVLNIDVHSEINPTNVILYTEDLNTYQLTLRLVDNNTYFIIPDTTKLTIKLNGIELPAEAYTIADKYRGTIKLNLRKDFFTPNGTKLNTAVAQMLTLELYSNSTFGLYQYTISVPITVVNGKDTGDQNFDAQLGVGDSGTTVPTPEQPSPPWNLTQSIKPPETPEEPDNPDTEVEHLIFDGGSFF